MLWSLQTLLPDRQNKTKPWKENHCVLKGKAGAQGLIQLPIVFSVMIQNPLKSPECQEKQKEDTALS